MSFIDNLRGLLIQLGEGKVKNAEESFGMVRGGEDDPRPELPNEGDVNRRGDVGTREWYDNSYIPGTRDSDPNVMYGTPYTLDESLPEGWTKKEMELVPYKDPSEYLNEGWSFETLPQHVLGDTTNYFSVLEDENGRIRGIETPTFDKEFSDSLEAYDFLREYSKNNGVSYKFRGFRHNPGRKIV